MKLASVPRFFGNEHRFLALQPDPADTNVRFEPPITAKVGDLRALRW
jgi:hypothetical protein